jgi:hypothetical protein
MMFAKCLLLIVAANASATFPAINTTNVYCHWCVHPQIYIQNNASHTLLQRSLLFVWRLPGKRRHLLLQRQ